MTRTIVENKKANFDFFIEEKIEAGISLKGWEVKSLRSVSYTHLTLPTILLV